MTITTNNVRFLIIGFLLGAWSLWMYCTQGQPPQPKRARQQPVKLPLDADFRQDVPA